MINAPASGGYDPGRGYTQSQAPQNASHSGGYGMQGPHSMNPGNLTNIQQVGNGYNIQQHMASRGMISSSSGPMPQLVNRFVSSAGVGIPFSHQPQLQTPLSQANIHPQQSLPSQYSSMGMSGHQLPRASLSSGGMSNFTPGGLPNTSSVSSILGSSQAQPVPPSGIQARNPRSGPESQMHGQARSMMAQNGPSVHGFNSGRTPVNSHVGIPSGNMQVNVSQGMRLQQQMQTPGQSNGIDTPTVSSQGSGMQPMNSSGGFGNSNGEYLAFLNNTPLSNHPKKAGAVANNGSAVNGISEAYSMNNNLNMYSHRNEQSQLPFGNEDFPSLSGGNRPGLPSGPNQAPDMASVARGLASNQEFSIQNEDFPELPGYKGSDWGSSRLEQSLETSTFFPTENSSNIAIVGGRRTNSTGKPSQHGSAHLPRQRSGTSNIVGDSQAAPVTGMTSTRGQASSGTNKQEGHHDYGLMGLLSVIKMGDPDLTMLAHGTDLTTLGLNLNASEPLCQRFASPWAVDPVSSSSEFDKIDADSSSVNEFSSAVPACYFQPSAKLSSTAIQKLGEDTLLYVFYTMPGDHAQMLSAQELSSRGWMYHKELKSWFCRAQGSEPTKKNSMEKGSYTFFDVNTWERVRKTDFVLQYSDVEKIPSVESNREDS